MANEIDCSSTVVEHSTDPYFGISQLTDNSETTVDEVDFCECAISRKERMAEVLSQDNVVEPVLQGTPSHTGSKSPGVL